MPKELPPFIELPSWLNTPLAPLNTDARERARARQQQLTKPLGSLGRLETLAEQFAGWQGIEQPSLERIRLCVFAADHGIAVQGVSAYPREVTAQMVSNFCAGGAAVSVLGKRYRADFRVVNLGCVSPPPSHPTLRDCTIASGTADFTREPAMTEAQLRQALTIGREQVLDAEVELFVGGDMGIGNTSSASALQAALLGLRAEQVAGPGTGIDAAALRHKRALIDRALALHQLNGTTSAGYALQCVGGFEIAALVGAYIACGQRGIPALVDGYISTAAALVACRLCEGLEQWLLFAHESAEPGHRLMLEVLGATPLLSLGMRLGEGSGAALAIPIIQSALALHREMATFAEAGVSDG